MAFRVQGDWRNFDVQTAADGITQAILTNGYATLLSADRAGKLTGYLAQSWKVTPNSITFTLRTDATCADGTPVTPDVVKNSFQRMIDVKAAPNPSLFGPGPYSVSADNSAGTVTFTTGGPFGDLVWAFVNIYPGTHTGIICPAGLAPGADLLNKWYGAGPYVLVEATHGDHVTMRLRPDFKWGPLGITGKTLGMAETVTYKVIANETTAANLVSTGGLDITQVTGPDVDRLIADRSLRHDELFTFVPSLLVVNELPGRPGNDEAVRQALLTAIDPKAWLSAANNGHGRLSPSFITPDAHCYDPNTARLGPKPSVDEAKKILQGDGYTISDGKAIKGGQPLTINLLGYQAFNAGPEYLVRQWTQLGAAVTLNNPDFRGYGSGVQGGNWDATIVSTGGPVPIPGPPAARISGPLPPAGTNYARLIDPVLDQELLAGRSTLGDESCRHWAVYQEELIKKHHLLPLSAANTEIFTRGIDTRLGVTPIWARRVQ